MDNWLRRTLKPGDTFLDVGADCCHHTALSACLVGIKGRVIAFEPNKTVVAKVGPILQRQGLSQVEIHRIGLSSQAGSFPIFGQTHDRIDFQNKLPLTNENNLLICEVCIGDEVLTSHVLRGRVFFKIDAKGMELEVIKGLKNTIEKSVDAAIIEISPEWIGGRDGVMTILDLMTEAGLNAYRLSRNGTPEKPLKLTDFVRQQDVLFLRELNLLANTGLE